MSTYTHPPLPKVSTYIYPDSNMLYTYTFGIVNRNTIWVGCQGGAHMHQGDENSVQHCLPVRCPSLFLSIPLAPSLSLLSSLAPQSLKKELWRGFWGKGMSLFQKIFLRNPVSTVTVFPVDLDIRP